MNDDIKPLDGSSSQPQQSSIAEKFQSQIPQESLTPKPQVNIPAQNDNQEKEYYVGTIPVEKASKHSGRLEGVIAIIFAIIALGLFPPVFGVVGIVLGIRASKKGYKTLGVVAITLSAVFMALGMIIGFGVSSLNKGK